MVTSHSVTSKYLIMLHISVLKLQVNYYLTEQVVMNHIYISNKMTPHKLVTV